MIESQVSTKATGPSPFKPVLFIGVVFLAAVAIFVVARFAAPGEKVPWRTDLASARQEAAEARKGVLVYFTADWCGPCQQMKRTVFTDPAVDDALRRHVAVKIDIDKQPVIARKYAVNSIPHFAIVDLEGEVVQATSGAMSSAELIEWIKQASKARKW